MKLVLATGNKGKIREISEILKDSNVELIHVSEFSSVELPPETGTTFEENALIKARHVADETCLMVLSDDSGLEVDALQGAPGVHSARYAGEGATDEDNNEKLIKEMEGVASGSRSARYRVVIAIAGPKPDKGEKRVEATFDGTMEGRIGLLPKGSGGFGYDPYFFLPELKKTSAELEPEEKNRLSHRGKAMEKAAHWLKGL